MHRADAEILNLLERELLDPDMVREAIDRVRMLASGRGRSIETRRAEVTATIATVDAELGRLTAALASGGELASVASAAGFVGVHDLISDRADESLECTRGSRPPVRRAGVTQTLPLKGTNWCHGSSSCPKADVTWR